MYVKFTAHSPSKNGASSRAIFDYLDKENQAQRDRDIQEWRNGDISEGHKLTDSEVFGFSQINSEHCRHKIFNGTFVINGEEKPSTLFKLIKKTSQEHPNSIVSAYKDNVAFMC